MPDDHGRGQAAGSGSGHRDARTGDAVQEGM
jgi:hypothetical protein